jgi:hemolysin activation/secretion protein
MVREQEMLLEELAEFLTLLDNSGSSGLLASLLTHAAPQPHMQHQQQQQQEQQQLQQQQQPPALNNYELQQQQQPQPSSVLAANSSSTSLLAQAMQRWTIRTVTDVIYPVSTDLLLPGEH